MKSLTTSLFASALCLLATATTFAQYVIPAVSLGDPVPTHQPDPNLVRVSGSSCATCPATLGFQACAGGCKDTIVTVACPGDCKAATPACSAPSCAVAAKPAPCKICELPKLFQHAPAATPCSTCSAPAPAPCKTCAAPVACAPCAAKPACEVTKPAPCTKCAAPAPAPCATCDPCKASAHKTEYHRPILESVKNFFSSPLHHAAPAKAEGCSTCAANTASATAPVNASIQPIPMQAPTMIPQTASYERPIQTSAPVVPAALAPYSGQAPFSTALPPAEGNFPPR